MEIWHIKNVSFYKSTRKTDFTKNDSGKIIWEEEILIIKKSTSDGLKYIQ